ncbi:MAG TPA: acetate/propionate family kinase [Alphaproteobacteria bacterium]|nr:acetate kinase [Rhodospirillaceae bacterium]HRJ12312.1 acetate/propionate family kinase [Alphaproteobacteria bacterium]
MTDVILVLNAGSSSLKFQVFAIGNLSAPLANGRITGIGNAPVFCVSGQADKNLQPQDHHQKCLAEILSWLSAQDWQLRAVGHRIVHGGTKIQQHCILDDKIIAYLETLVPLAPLHQPHHLHAIATLRRAYPNLLQIGCFDTVFHARQSKLQQSFALPEKYFVQGVRRYGFHGLSYEWISRKLNQDYPTLFRGRVVAAHLGNGASLCAMQGGKSLATTMGMTAIDGLPMGTRSGAIDPGAVLYLIREQKMSAEEVEHLLSYESGLLGLSGVSNDMRVLRNAAVQNPHAQFAINYFIGKIAEGIAALVTTLGGMDVLVFTGGIGENDRALREDVVGKLSFMQHFETVVIPANEEAVIADYTLHFLSDIRG